MTAYEKRYEVRLREFRDELLMTFPPLVARKSVEWLTGGKIKSTTLANEDSIGKGPKRRQLIAGEVVYTREAFVDWLLTKGVEVIHVPEL